MQILHLYENIQNVNICVLCYCVSDCCSMNEFVFEDFFIYLVSIFFVLYIFSH